MREANPQVPGCRYTQGAESLPLPLLHYHEPGGRTLIPASIGHYALREEIARTNTGAVYRGLDQQSGRAVHVKVAPRGEAAFRAEPEKIAGLDHPQIVPIRDAFHSPDGDCVLVQDVPLGRTLADAFSEFEGNYRHIAQFIHDAASVLASAHAAGVTHGDISPRTLLVGDSDEALFSEFGMGPVTVSSVGAPYSAGVENNDSHSTDMLDRAFKRDERADIFAMGAILYTMLSGRSPTAQPLALLSDPAGPADDIASIDRVAPEAPAELRAICARALSTDPVHRYLHAEDLARDLEHYLCGRRPSPVGRIVLIAAAATTVLLFSLWGSTGGGPARIVDVSARIGSPSQSVPLRSAERAMSYRDPIHIRVQLSKPAFVSVYYRSPTGRVTRLGTTENQNLRQVYELPSGAGWRLPERGGMGVLVIASHSQRTPPDSSVDAALVTAGEPPKTYTPIIWNGRSLSLPQPPATNRAEAGSGKTVAEYADAAIRSITSDTDDAAIGVLYVIGL